MTHVFHHHFNTITCQYERCIDPECDYKKCPIHGEFKSETDNCLYCTVEGNEASVQTQEMYEYAYAMGEIVELGFNDYMKGVIKEYSTTTQNYTRETNTYRRLYNMGQKMAQQKINS